MPQFGTGTNLLGNTDALKQAMSSRGVDSSILDQVSGSSATFNPQTAGVGINAPNTVTNAPVSSPSAQQSPDNDISTIIKALTKYLGNSQKNVGVGSNMPQTSF